MKSQTTSATTTVGQRTVPRAEHVGSLLRPAPLLEVHGGAPTRKFGAQKTSDSVRALEDSGIRDVLNKQLAVGLDVVTDGEFRRSTFMGSFDYAIQGFALDSGAPFVFRNDTETISAGGRIYVENRLEKVDSPSAREAAFLKTIAPNARRKITHIAASMAANPGAFKPGVTDRHYADPLEMFAHILTLERQLIDEAIEAGANYVQLDFPGYPLLVDDEYRRVFVEQGIDVKVALEGMLAADRQIVAGLPGHVRTALHLCRGNGPRGTWLSSGSLEPIAERVFSLPYDSFLVEWDDQRRQGDFSALAHVPKGPIVGVGLISTKTPVLESEDDILRQLEQASRYLDYDQLALCPQCGFATNASGSSLTEDDQWRKLELVARVADRIWPR